MSDRVNKIQVWSISAGLIISYIYYLLAFPESNWFDLLPYNWTSLQLNMAIGISFFPAVALTYKIQSTLIYLIVFWPVYTICFYFLSEAIFR